MTLSLFLARRYLFSRKSHSSINIISLVSACGIMLATAAMVCVLSVFNGFRDLIATLYSQLDPELQVLPAQGKRLAADDGRLALLERLPQVQAASRCLQEEALILYKGNPLVVTLLGVDEQYRHVTQLDSITLDANMRPAPLPPLRAAEVSYGVPGVGLACQMGINFGLVQLCAPLAGERINMANPIESFNVDDLYATGRCFRVNQRQYDDHLLIVPLEFAQGLFDAQGLCSSLALRLRPGADAEQAKRSAERLLGPSYRVLTQMEQHRDTFNVMQIEKAVAWLFLSFIVLVACFNLIGSVAMLIIDKRENILTLRSLGATRGQLTGVFLMESRLVTLLGAAAGCLLGVALCLGQQQFGWLRLGTSQGSFIVDAYPVSLNPLEVLLVLCTVLLTGWLVVWWPLRYLTRKTLGE